ncbi:hypothetical protein HHUSO_G36890, partial [Huso huso]
QMQSEEFPGEDAHSIAKHLDSIRKEITKLRPNIEAICDSMNRIVHTRERMMEKKSTEEVLGLFPFLKHPKLVGTSFYSTMVIDQKLIFLVISMYNHFN